MSTKEFLPKYVERHSILIDLRKFVDEYDMSSVFNEEMMSDACDIIFHYIYENVSLLSVKTKSDEEYRLIYVLALMYMVKIFHANINIYTDDTDDCLNFIKSIMPKFGIDEKVFFIYVNMIPMEKVLTNDMSNYSIVDGNDDEFLTYLTVTHWTSGVVMKDI